MNIILRRLPATVRGIYGPAKNTMPKRALFIHPDAYKSFMALIANATMVFSDILRSAESSMAAIAAGRGAQPPGYSGHNFGLAFDVAVGETLALNAWKYEHLLSYLSANGWECYRRDGTRGKEDWHFNFMVGLNMEAFKARAKWQTAAEASIQERYRGQFSLDEKGIQAALAKLGLYKGEVDGDIGPLSRQAIAAFARSWNLKDGFDIGPRFQRTLAFVSADINVQEDAPPLVA
jgi:hypothetical protein